MTETYSIIDSVSADSIEVGDQIIIDGELVEVRHVSESGDIDEVVVAGYSNSTGDIETYSLYADDYFEVWSV